MHAITMLTEDHKKVRTMLKDGEDTTEQAVKTRTELLAKLAEELRVHETIEEEIFYPALEEHAKTKDIALEGYEEHHVVDGILEELDSTPVEDDTWSAKFAVMKENLEHHIEEEEGEMFKTARSVFDRDELERLGARMSELKEAAKQLA